jgi:hypothetical protein
MKWQDAKIKFEETQKKEERQKKERKSMSSILSAYPETFNDASVIGDGKPV